MSDLDIIEGMSNASSSIRYQALVQPATATTSQPVPVRQRASLTVAQPVLERPAQPTTRGSRPRPTEQSRPHRAASSVEPITRANTNGPKPRPTPYQAHQVAQVTHDLDLDDEQSAQATVPLDLESEQEQDAEMSARTTLLGDDTNADIQVHMPPVPYRRPQPQALRRSPALVFVGLGMVSMLLLWAVVVPICSFMTLNISNRWGHGPDHVTVLHGVFGHNKDSQAHPTRLEAYIEQGRVEIAETAAGDPAHAHIYIGPTLLGWQGSTSDAIIDMRLSDISHNGRYDVLLDVRGSSLNWLFQPQELKVTLVNMGESFKVEGGQ